MWSTAERLPTTRPFSTSWACGSSEGTGTSTGCGDGFGVRIGRPGPGLEPRSLPFPPVPLSVQLGIVMAAITALASIVGFLLKHRGAVAAPDVEWRHPVRSTIDLFKSPVYTLGCVVATTSWGFHVAALALAPISVVQSVIAGGLVLLTVVADRFFGHSVTRREWIGVALVAVGLAFLAATMEGTADSAYSDYETGTL